MKDKRNRHGAVGKSSSEQHFHKSATITFIVRNFWSPTPSTTGSYSRQVADEMQVNFEIFKTNCTLNIRLFASFSQVTALLQQY